MIIFNFLRQDIKKETIEIACIEKNKQLGATKQIN
jgi:hypothetical protein